MGFFCLSIGCICLDVFFELVYTLYCVKFKALLPYVKLLIYIVCFMSRTLCIYYNSTWQILLILFLLIPALKIFFSSSDVFFILLNLLSRCWLIIRELLDFILYPYFKLVNIFLWLSFCWLLCWRLIIIVIMIIIIDIVAWFRFLCHLLRNACYVDFVNDFFSLDLCNLSGVWTPSPLLTVNSGV
jgi:hypothetical protein